MTAEQRVQIAVFVLTELALMLACGPAAAVPQVAVPSVSPFANAAASPSPVVACGEPWRQRVRRPQRFSEVAACVTFTGTVRAVKTEADGDLHVQVLPDPPADGYLNQRNHDAQHGAIVVEIEPYERGSASSALGAAALNSHQPDPYCPANCALRAGDRVQISGAITLDQEGGHGWVEAHSPNDLRVIGHVAPPHGNVDADPTEDEQGDR